LWDQSLAAPIFLWILIDISSFARGIKSARGCLRNAVVEDSLLMAAHSMHVHGWAAIDRRAMDLPMLVSDPDAVPAAAKIGPAQGQVTRQFVGHGLGAFGVSKRHAAEVRQDPAINHEIKIEPRHAGSRTEKLATPNGVRAAPCCGELLKALPPAGNAARAHRPFG
jgi:hypothetical protein